MAVNINIKDGIGDSAVDGTDTFKGNVNAIVGQILTTDTDPSSIFASELEGLTADTNVVLQASSNITFDDILSTNSLQFQSLANGGGGMISFTAGNLFSFQDKNDEIVAPGRSFNALAANIVIGGIDVANNVNEGNGGAITLKSFSNIYAQALSSGSSATYGTSAGNGGAIALDSSASISTSNLSSGSSAQSGIAGNGGAITINSSGSIYNASLSSDSHSDDGSSSDGGAITINSIGNINENITSSTSSNGKSNILLDDSGGVGNGGAITINSSGSIYNGYLSSYSTNYHSGTIMGNGGAITLNSSSGDINGIAINSFSSGNAGSSGSSGNGGAITINSSDNIYFNGISSFSNTGNGGDVNLTAGNSIEIGRINTVGHIKSGNIVLTANKINFLPELKEGNNGSARSSYRYYASPINTVRGDGQNIVLQPSNPNQAIQIGGSDSGISSILDITKRDLDAIAPNFSNITIGRSDSSGEITIEARARYFTSPVTFRTPNGQININSVLEGNLNFISNGLNISNGNILILGKSEEIVDTANLNLNGGTLRLNGFNETANQLTFSTTNSAIDFGNGNSTLAFSSSSNQTWTGLLTINNWSSSSGETLKFGNDANALTATQLSQIQFTGSPEYDKGAQISSTGVVTPNLLSTLSVTASTPTGTETNSTLGIFTVSSIAEANADLPFNYTVSGTATNGVDYTNLVGTATIAAGKSSVDIAVTPVDDGIVEGNESVKLTLASGTGYITNATKSSASITIIDNSPTSVGTTGNDDLVATTGSKFDGLSNNVFTGSGNDVIDLAINPASNSNRVDLGSGNDTIFVSKNDRVFGSAGDDIFEATDGKGGNRMSGGAGNDTFFLGFGDRALGGDGDDKFFVGTGSGNLLSGGAGADQFWIFNGEALIASNTILDFQAGTDVIGFQGAGVGFGIANLTLSGNNISLKSDPTKILATLTGVDTTSLTASNFVFI